ncbi:hypothetical protein ACFLV7_03460 [Chloroflexota bacterium]
MSVFDPNNLDLLGTILGYGFTLIIFSFIIGDNLLFRFAIHVFVGVAAGYVTVMTWYNVLLPGIVVPIIGGSQAERFFALLALVLSILLLMKVFQRLSGWGSPVVAYLVGVGAATVIGGAVLGTLFPQVLASINLFDFPGLFGDSSPVWVQISNAVVILIGTFSALIFFHFGARNGHDRHPERAAWISAIGWIGQIFIAITFGVVFAGVYIASMTAFVERVMFLANFILLFFQR